MPVHEVRGPGTGGCKADAGFSRRPRITVRRMSRRLFVARQDEPDVMSIVQLVEDRNDDTAGIPEQDVDFLLSQAFYEYIRSAEFHVFSSSMLILEHRTCRR